MELNLRMSVGGLALTSQAGTHRLNDLWLNLWRTIIMHSKFGKRLALARHSQRLTLEDLARSSGLTKSYLSKIERARSVPSIAAAIKLARALNLGVSELLGDGEPAGAICVDRRGERQPFQVAGASRYSFQALALQRRFKQMEPFLARPAQSLPQDVRLSEHDGEELLYVVSGQVEVIFPDQKVKLRRGDSIYFDTGLPHRSRSLGKRPAEILIVISRNMLDHPRKHPRRTGKRH